MLVVNILLIESGAVFKQKVSCSQHFVLIISKDYFFGGAGGGGGGGRLSVTIRDKLPTLRVRFGFCLFSILFYFKTKNIIMCSDIVHQ